MCRHPAAAPKLPSDAHEPSTRCGGRMRTHSEAPRSSNAPVADRGAGPAKCDPTGTAA